MVASPDAGEVWSPWCVAPTSGFEVDDARGEVALVQIDRKQFRVTKAFRFTDPEVETRLIERLVHEGRTDQQARAAVDDARLFTPTTENPTDLASIPRYLRWFESSYGAHTLAAIIHDDLIVDEPNGGPLGSDTLSDRFFRQMMGSAGVPWLKRWIMWAAVALRSRWAVGGLRRASIVVWIVLAVLGIGTLGWAAGSAIFGWDVPGSTGLLVTGALLLPVVAAPLWGKQYGGGLVAALAGLWIVPAAVFAGIGYVVYLALEGAAKAFRRR